MSISVWSSDVCASDRDAAYDGGRRQSGWQSKGRERCRPAKPREALPPPCQASAGLFLEARVQQAEMWQSDLGRVAAPAQPSLLELALGDHALVVVEQLVDLLAVDAIGRSSGMERVCPSVSISAVAVALKKQIISIDTHSD